MSYVVSMIGKHAGEVLEMPHHVAEACVLAQGTHRWATPEDIKRAETVRQEGFVPMVDENVLPPGYAINPDPVRGFHVLDPGGVPLTVDPVHNRLAALEYARAHYNDVGGSMVRPKSQEEQEAEQKQRAEQKDAAEAELEMKRQAAQERADRYGVQMAPKPAEDGPHRDRVPRVQPGSAQEGPKPAPEHPRAGRRE